MADYRTMTMLSGSMAPNCPTGSLVIARPQPAPELRTGQVLTYHIPLEDHRVVSHRIIGVERQDGAIVVRTKGDANNGPDPWQARIDDQTAWTVRSCIPHVGNVLLALRQPLVLPVVKWLLPGILLTWLLAGIWWPRGRHG